MKILRSLFYVFVMSTGLFLVSLVFFSSLDYNVNTPDYTIKLLFNLSAPEGWGFFTRSPREEVVDLYSIEKGQLQKVLERNGHYSNLFGISRKSRKLGMESSILVQKVNDSLWLKDNDISKIDIPNIIHNVDDENLFYLSKGDFVLLKRKTIPWSWKKNINKKDVPYEIIRVKVGSADQQLGNAIQ